MYKLPCFPFLSILLTLAISACSAPQDCQKFRNGKFKMIFNGHTTIITRSGNIQIERREGVENTLNVKWADDCTYILTPTKEMLKKSPETPKDAFVKVEITKVNKDSYVQSSTSNFSDKVLTAEIFRIK